MAKEKLIGIRAKTSIVRQSRCASGNNTTLIIVNWQSAILATKATGD